MADIMAAACQIRPEFVFPRPGMSGAGPHGQCRLALEPDKGIIGQGSNWPQRAVFLFRGGWPGLNLPKVNPWDALCIGTGTSEPFSVDGKAVNRDG